MKNLSRTSKVMMAWSAAVSLFLLIAGLLAIRLAYPFEGAAPYIAGIILGCAHSIIKVPIMEKSILRTMDMSKKGAESLGRVHFIWRYFLTAIVFIIVILSRGFFGLFGTIGGVLSLQAAAFITGNILKNKNLR